MIQRRGYVKINRFWLNEKQSKFYYKNTDDELVVIGPGVKNERSHDIHRV